MRNNNSEEYDDYGHEQSKVKVNSDDNSPLEKCLEMCDVIILVRSVLSTGHRMTDSAINNKFDEQ